MFWGSNKVGPVPYYRGGMFEHLWPRHGIEAIYLDHTTGECEPEALDDADVVVFHRWYAARSTAGQLGADPVTIAAWRIAGERGLRRIYESDDNDIGPIRRDNPQGRLMTAPGVPELIHQMLREADLTIVSTPELALRYRAFTPRIRVIRNAIDRSLYHSDEPEVIAGPTGLFYGSGSRLRDFVGGLDAQGRWNGGYAHAAAKDHRLRLIWLGDDGRDPPEARVFDRVIPYVRDIPTFARTLTGIRAHVGFAPLGGGEFDVCKSELHWLDMSAAGIPVIAQRMMGGGPYGVIEHGVDGLLARGRQEWSDACRRLIASESLRADIVAAAQARLDAEYHPVQRAAEWASALLGAP